MQEFRLEGKRFDLSYVETQGWGSGDMPSMNVNLLGYLGLQMEVCNFATVYIRVHWE